MDRLFSQGITLILLYLFFPVQGSAESVPTQPKGISMASNTGVFENEEGVRIHYINQPLREVLHEIQDQIGIQFPLKEQMQHFPVSVDITASNWESALDRLLRDYSIIKFWDGQSNLSKVHLLGVGKFPSSSYQNAEVADAPKRKKPAWKCFSLSGKRKC